MTKHKRFMENAQLILNLMDEIQSLRTENERLRKALEFYADPDTYDANGALDRKCTETGYRPDIYLIDAIKNDKGKEAREALMKEE